MWFPCRREDGQRSTFNFQADGLVGARPRWDYWPKPALRMVEAPSSIFTTEGRDTEGALSLSKEACPELVEGTRQFSGPRLSSLCGEFRL